MNRTSEATMLLPIPEEVLQAQARERALDILLGALGVSAAVISVSFAAYMGMTGPGGRATMRPASFAASSGGPNHAPRTIAALPASEPPPLEGAGIDFGPTGSIPPSRRGRVEAPPAATPILSDFAVRDAFDGTALVEAHGTLHMVQPGATIEGAGQVLSIKRRGNGWVVATTEGLIQQRR